MDVTLVVLIAGGEDVGHAWVAKKKTVEGCLGCATRCEAGSWDWRSNAVFLVVETTVPKCKRCDLAALQKFLFILFNIQDVQFPLHKTAHQQSNCTTVPLFYTGYPQGCSPQHNHIQGLKKLVPSRVNESNEQQLGEGKKVLLMWRVREVGQTYGNTLGTRQEVKQIHNSQFPIESKQ